MGFWSSGTFYGLLEFGNNGQSEQWAKPILTDPNVSHKDRKEKERHEKRMRDR